MKKTVLISLPIEDLQTVIIDCVNSCLINNKQASKPLTDQQEELLTVAVAILIKEVRELKRLITENQAQPPTEQPEQLLTVHEAAEFLKLKVPTIYSKVSKGELPVMKQNNRLYFSRTELLDYLKAGRKKPNAEI